MIKNEAVPFISNISKAPFTSAKGRCDSQYNRCHRKACASWCPSPPWQQGATQAVDLRTVHAPPSLGAPLPCTAKSYQVYLLEVSCVSELPGIPSGPLISHHCVYMTLGGPLITGLSSCRLSPANPSHSLKNTNHWHLPPGPAQLTGLSQGLPMVLDHPMVGGKQN